eukprot:Skav236300  [mRNA]  locus=scaffold1398:127496:129519:+ [translate_table: standard]
MAMCSSPSMHGGSGIGVGSPTHCQRPTAAPYSEKKKWIRSDGTEIDVIPAGFEGARLLHVAYAVHVASVWIAQRQGLRFRVAATLPSELSVAPLFSAHIPLYVSSLGCFLTQFHSKPNCEARRTPLILQLNINWTYCVVIIEGSPFPGYSWVILQYYLSALHQSALPPFALGQLWVAMSRSGVTRTASVISKPASLTGSWRPIPPSATLPASRAHGGPSSGWSHPDEDLTPAAQVGRTPNAQQLILASHRTSSGARVVGVCAMAVNREILSLQNSVTSAAIIEAPRGQTTDFRCKVIS